MNDMRAGILVQRQLGTVAEGKGETLQDLVADSINAKLHVNRGVKSKDVEAEEPHETLADTLLEA